MQHRAIVKRDVDGQAIRVVDCDVGDGAADSGLDRLAQFNRPKRVEAGNREPPCAPWRLHALEWRIGSCQPRRSRGSRRRGGWLASDDRVKVRGELVDARLELGSDRSMSEGECPAQPHSAQMGTARMRSSRSSGRGPVCRTIPAAKRSCSRSRSHVRCRASSRPGDAVALTSKAMTWPPPSSASRSISWRPCSSRTW